MNLGTRSISAIFAALLLVGMLAFPAVAQEASDYPPEVDGEVIDAVDEVDGVEDDVEVGEVVDAAEVRGVALARTGGEVLYLLMGAVVLGGLGTALLLAQRRSRSVTNSS